MIRQRTESKPNILNLIHVPLPILTVSLPMWKLCEKDYWNHL